MNSPVVILAAALLALPAAALAEELLADANHDGKVTLIEYQNSRWDFISKSDNNKDGLVSKAEWDRGAKNLRIRLEADGVRDADIVGRGDGFRIMDTNADGQISRPECDAYFARHFAMIDTNRDGYITHAEADTAMRTAAAKH